MLILTRRTGETIAIGDNIEVTVLGVKGNQVRIGVGAPKEVEVDRREIRDRCLPAGDAECTARQLEASCRVWAADAQNGPGLCARRRDEARAARAGA